MSVATAPADVDAAATPSAAASHPPARRFAASLREAVPHGGTLPIDQWQRRHNAIIALLAVHSIAIWFYALVRGLGPFHATLEALAVASFGVIAYRLARTNRTASAAAASAGLLTASALLVHVSGGFVEFHFHFFVMIGIIALYEDWVPFAVAVAYVALHHGVVGTWAPELVYNHPDALAHPWKWAAIHAAFVLAASVVSIVAWRQNERSRA